MRRARTIDRRLAKLRGQAAATAPASDTHDLRGRRPAFRVFGLALLRCLSMVVPVGATEREKLAVMLRTAGFERQEALSVSLGVFGKRSNADRRVAEFKRLGYEVEVTASGKTVGEYIVRARAGTARGAFNGDWKARFAGYSIRYIDCPALN